MDEKAVLDVGTTSGGCRISDTDEEAVLGGEALPMGFLAKPGLLETTPLLVSSKPASSPFFGFL
jgi:hypothetical protein